MIVNKYSGAGSGGTYVLPVATDSTLGGVKVGSGLTIDSGGTLSTSGGSAGGGDYVVVDALSAITNPKEGMKAYVNPTGAVMNRMSVFTIPEGLTGWSEGISGFDGADLDFYLEPLEQVSMPYNANIGTVGRYWQMAATNLYTKYEDGALQIIWDNSTWPNAIFTSWAGFGWLTPQQGQFVADTREEAGRTYIYKGGKWIEDRKVYYVPDLKASSALTKDICDRTSQGEMDIMLRYTRALFPCYSSSPNNWSIGETIFKGYLCDTEHFMLWRWFIRWEDYGIDNDSEGSITLES